MSNIYEIVYNNGKVRLVKGLPHPAPLEAKIYRLYLDRDTLKLRRRRISEDYK